ncbi:hypothetical protein ACG3SL_08210 [Sphingomonas sp. CJ20]
MPLLMLIILALAVPTTARARSGAGQVDADAPVALTPRLIGDALSCRLRDAFDAVADALFRDPRLPAWIQETTADKATKGMLGIEGYRLTKPVLLMGQRVNRVYFLNNWIVTLRPRKVAETFIAAHDLKRAPITITEQYYHFLDPKSGPMLGAFAPTGTVTAAPFAEAFGAKPAPPPPPADRLFVGCNYAIASEADFIDAARRASDMAADASRDIAGDAAVIVPPQ